MEGKQYVAIVYGAGGGGIWPLYYANFLKTHTKGGGLMVFSASYRLRIMCCTHVLVMCVKCNRLVN